MSGRNGSPRVAITGIGAVTPLGLDAESTWQSCRRGQGGIGPITAFDSSHLTTQIAGEVKGFDPEVVLGRKEARRTSRCTQLALFAARQAIEDSGLDIRPMAEDVGVLVASGVGGIEVIERNVLALYNQGPRRVSPFTVPSMIIDMPAGAIAIDCGAKGVNYAIVSACSSSGHAIGEAAEWIRRGEATAIITGGTEASITNISVAAFDAMQALSTRNDEPERASRPFDKDRDGFVMGEGAGMFVIEDWGHAVARGAHIYGEVAGLRRHRRRVPHHPARRARRRRATLHPALAQTRRPRARRGRLHQRARYVDADERRRRNPCGEGSFRASGKHHPDVVDQVDARPPARARPARSKRSSRFSPFVTNSCRRRSTWTSPTPSATSTTCPTMAATPGSTSR